MSNIDRVTVLVVDAIPRMTEGPVRKLARRAGLPDFSELTSLSMGHGILVVAGNEMNYPVLSTELRYVHQFERANGIEGWLHAFVPEAATHGTLNAARARDARQAAMPQPTLIED